MLLDLCLDLFVGGTFRLKVHAVFVVVDIDYDGKHVAACRFAGVDRGVRIGQGRRKGIRTLFWKGVRIPDVWQRLRYLIQCNAFRASVAFVVSALHFALSVALTPLGPVLYSLRLMDSVPGCLRSSIRLFLSFS